ncbi:MAG TPA: hypothetical protein VHF25_13090 [Nitriliruptorales bacterium]|nr:hypothetical protein [Nitriliruptorales bacterium]
MSTPLVYIFSVRLQDGKLADYRQYAREHAAFAERVHPDILAFHLYLSEDQTRVSAVQVHPDPDSMDLWMKAVVAEHGLKAYDYLERGTERSLGFGTLDQATLKGIREFGVPLDLNPEHLAGFTRLRAG